MELLLEPDVGWRVWKVIDEHLQSLVYTRRWEPYEAMHALCGHHQRFTDPHRAPRSGCKCGIHSMETRAQITAYRDKWVSYQSKPPRLVIGRVSLWGHVVRTEMGFRAEFAYPLALVGEPGLCRAYAVAELQELSQAV